MQILLDIIIGSPYADCGKFGVCEINLLPPEPFHSFVPKHWRHVKAMLRLEASNACFYFPFEGMMQATKKAFFSETGFRVDAPKSFNPDILVALGCTASCQIMPGIYDVEVQEKGFGVKIQVLPVPKVDALLPCNVRASVGT